MIKTVGDLLQALMVREAAVLGKQDVDHTLTIGAMYEGLTQDALRRALPRSAPISVVGGFARDSKGTKSRQLDCMIVFGDGEPVPYTPLFTYPIEQVLVVIEVKKTLYKQQFDEGFQNLRSLLALKIADDFQIPEMLESAFQLISGQALPDNPDDIKDPLIQQLYHILVVESAYPARILLGYEGYKSGRALRKGIVSHLQAMVDAGGANAGPSSLPDLIMNTHEAVVKVNGFPFVGPLKDGSWPLLCSIVNSKPALALLEVIWTRLHMRVGGTPEMFGEDLDLEAVAKLVDYKYVPDKPGWSISVFPDVSNEELRAAEQRRWEPIFIDETEHVLLLWLCNNQELDISSPPSGAEPERVQAAIRRLVDTRLVGPDASRTNVFRLLTTKCKVVILPDGKIVAGEDISGRLTRC